MKEKWFQFWIKAKFNNAASFGIPTIALDEKAFWEIKGTYVPVGTLEAFLGALDGLINNPISYNNYSLECIKQAERYHIENIAKLYEQL